MEPNPRRFRAELIALVAMLLVGGFVWMVRNLGNPFRSAPPVLVRQSIPPPSALELPPTAPMNEEEHPFFSPITPNPQLDSEKKESAAKKAAKPKRKIPTKWEIINRYRQVVELDMKYVQIGVTCDRYGYRNMAITYYRKYLSIAPTGPYANQVRSRLSQLENAP